jgi:hypothetical protein
VVLLLRRAATVAASALGTEPAGGSRHPWPHCRRESPLGTIRCAIPTCDATELHAYDAIGVRVCNPHGWLLHYYELAVARAETPVSLTKYPRRADDCPDWLTWYRVSHGELARRGNQPYALNVSVYVEPVPSSAGRARLSSFTASFVQSR